MEVHMSGDHANAMREFLLVSDFDQTLSFNDSGIVLSELLRVSGFHERIAGLVNIHLVQQGGELAYLILHETVLAVSGRSAFAVASLALTYADWGQPADAESLYKELQARSERQYVPHIQLALAAWSVGRGEEMIRHARQAYICQHRA
jgi:hypothetical protein